MNRRFLIACLIAVLTAIAAPAVAQDDAVPACPPDLSGIIADLNAAQTADPAAAIVAMSRARDLLRAAELDCTRAGVILLDTPFIAPNDTFTLMLPRGWRAGLYSPSDSGGVLFAGNTPTAERMLNVEEPPVNLGEVGAQILVGQRAQTATLEQVVGEFEVLIRLLYPDSSATEYYTLDGRPAARFGFRLPTADGVLVGVALGDGRFTVIRGIAGIGALDALMPTIEAIAASVN